MAATLKYAPVDPNPTLKNQWDKLKLNNRRINILASGTADQYMKKRWKNSIVATVVAAVLLSVGILAIVLFTRETWGKAIAQSGGIIVGVVFAGMTVALPIAAWWLLWFIFSLQSHISCRTLIRFGQNKASDLSVDAVKKKITIARWICAVTAVISGAAIFGCAAAINDFVARICVCAIFNIFFAASLYFLTLGLRNVGRKAKLVGKYACEECGYVNTIFYGGSYRHDYGNLESRVVDASPTSYTAGTIYNSSGTKIGTVIGHDTTYTYAEGRTYKQTSYTKCACCSNETTSESSGFEETRRYKV